MRAIRKRNGFFRCACKAKWKPVSFWTLQAAKKQNHKGDSEGQGSILQEFQSVWKTGKILNKNNISTPALVRNGTTVCKDCDKASMLNQYLSECFNMAQSPPWSRYEEPNIGTCPVDFLCTKEEVYEMLLSSPMHPRLMDQMAFQLRFSKVQH